jgi:hypothetical protein
MASEEDYGTATDNAVNGNGAHKTVPMNVSMAEIISDIAEDRSSDNDIDTIPACAEAVST